MAHQTAGDGTAVAAPPPVRAELLAIGEELLLGDNVDTNSAWISRRLRELGVRVVRHTTVGDKVDDMVEALEVALGRADVVLTTGGLGPTQDDLTRLALARVAGVDVVRDDAMVEEIAAYFAERGRDMPATNLQQADLPRGAWWLSRVGSAPGLAMEVRGRLVACMPGVPREMQVMLDDDVVPLLRQRGATATTVSRTVRTAGRSESGIAADLADLVAEVEADGRLDLAFLASRGETRVKVTATAADRRAALALLDPVVERIVAAVGRGVVGLDEEGVEHAVGRALLDAGLTVAVAESVTGGGVGARLASVPGASGWFRGGLITYATDAKARLAGLAGSVLEGAGPVSREAAEALAVAAADRLQADVGLGIVGVAGPDPVDDVAVGTVRVAIAVAGRVAVTRDLRMPGRARQDVQDFGASAALALLLDAVREAAADPRGTAG